MGVPIPIPEQTFVNFGTPDIIKTYKSTPKSVQIRDKIAKIAQKRPKFCVKSKKYTVFKFFRGV